MEKDFDKLSFPEAAKLDTMSCHNFPHMISASGVSGKIITCDDPNLSDIEEYNIISEYVLLVVTCGCQPLGYAKTVTGIHDNNIRFLIFIQYMVTHTLPYPPLIPASEFIPHSSDYLVIEYDIMSNTTDFTEIMLSLPIKVENNDHDDENKSIH